MKEKNIQHFELCDFEDGRLMLETYGKPYVISRADESRADDEISNYNQRSLLISPLVHQRENILGALNFGRFDYQLSETDKRLMLDLSAMVAVTIRQKMLAHEQTLVDQTTHLKTAMIIDEYNGQKWMDHSSYRSLCAKFDTFAGKVVRGYKKSRND
tara:strand:- start:3188 stop:3658 length:471 start_codon:yes stop_codon:yes gene_type:complete